MTQYMQVLREHGLRVTPQRELIIEFLSCTKVHPTAESIFEEVKGRCPALSLNTVYKTLEMFEKRGMVRRFIVGLNIYRYDANVTPHAHVICADCKRVDDINGKLSDLGERIRKEVDVNSDYEILSADLFFYGVCKECKEGGEE